MTFALLRPVVGYPVMFHACKMDPPVAGISRYIQYWATQVLNLKLTDVSRKPNLTFSQVVLGDHVRSLVLGNAQTYAQLKREAGGAVEVCNLPKFT